jgi:hypothetical protein
MSDRPSAGHLVDADGIKASRGIEMMFPIWRNLMRAWGAVNFHDQLVYETAN